MTVAAMRAGKYAATEVGPASSVDECWELVNTYEETRVPCMLLENYCYFRYNMAVLNMVRQGIFGELIHCTCGYGHDLGERIVLGKGTGHTPKGEGDYRPTTFMYQVQGTGGMWMQDGDSSSKDKSVIYLDEKSPKHEWEPFGPYQEKYEHPLWKSYLHEAETAGHGGTDFLELREFVTCIRNQTNLPIDAYDAAAWMAIAPLSEASIATGSAPIAFPDFTDGAWMTNKPIFGLT